MRLVNIDKPSLFDKIITNGIIYKDGGYMFWNSKFFIFTLGLAMGALALAPLISFKPCPKSHLNLFAPQITTETEALVKEIIHNNSTVAQTLITQLNEQHQHNLAQLQKAFPFTQEEWDHVGETLTFIKSQDAEYTPENTVPSNNPYVIMVRALLAQYEINPDKVTITLVNNPTKTMNASTGQGYANGQMIHEIEINIPQFSKLSTEVQEATLKHEIMHLKNYDPLERALISNLLEKHGFSAEQYESTPEYRAYYHHQEFRADLFASLDSIETGKALQKSCIDFLQKYPEKQNKNSHPSDLQRYYAIARLITYLEAENTLKSL